MTGGAGGSGSKGGHEALLAADLALALGIASARDVAAALQRYWDEREVRAVEFVSELVRIADLDAAAQARLRDAVARALADCADDARAALGRRGGIDRSIAVELTRVGANAGDLGADVRSPLRVADRDRYLDFRPIGVGGMGIVYLALDTELNRRVAFKVVRPDAGTARVGDAATSPLELTPPRTPDTPASQAFQTLTRRFLQEAWVTGALDHPGIVPVYELGQTPGGVPYYTMRFVRGERTLEQAIEAASSLEDRIALIEPFLKLCDTVRYAHSQGVIHRDLKPSNVALGQFGEVVLLDWGLAKFREREDVALSQWQERLQEFRRAQDLHTAASALGTPGYMAPEAAFGRSSEVDDRSDVYSLGVILYRILARRLPYEFTSYAELIQRLSGAAPPPPHEVDALVPEGLSRVCAAALRNDRESRTATAGELADGVRAWQRESARAREVEGLLREADAAIAGVETLGGDAQVRQLDRTASLASRILELSPGHAGAAALAERAARLRRGAIERREASTRRQTLRRAAAAAAALLVTVTGVAAFLLDAKRREAETARADEAAARTRAETAEGKAKDSEARALTALAETQRERDAKADALRRARGLGLAAAASELRDHQPMRALLLAREAARLEPSIRSERALWEALHASHERLVLLGDVWPRAEFSPDGTRILMAYGDKTARVHDLAGNELAVLRGQHRGGVSSAAYSRDATRIVTVANDGAARVWDASGRELAVLRIEAERSGIDSASFSPDGTRIVTVCSDRTARVWDVSGRELAVLRGHEDNVATACFSPDGQRIVTASAGLLTSHAVGISKSGDRTARVWDADGKELAVLRGHAGPVWTAVFSSDGARIVTASDDRTARVWDTAGHELSVLGGHEGALNSAVFSPDGRHVLTASDDRTARLWDESGREIAVLRGHTAPVQTAAFSSDGGRVVTASGDQTARVWDLLGRELIVLRGHTDSLRTAAFSSDGKRVITTGWGDEVRVWELAGEEEVVLAGHEGHVAEAAFSPDGTRVLTVSYDGTVRIWDARGGALATLRIPEAHVTWAAFSPDGTRVVAAWSDGTARVCDLSGSELAVLRGHKSGVSRAEFSHDGSRIVTAGDDATARLWSAAGEQLAVLRGHQDAVELALFSPDGTRVLTVARDRTARVWDLAGKELAALRGHTNELIAGVFSSDGTQIVTTSNDKTARVWDVSGRQLAKLEGHGSRVTSAAFSPDGTRIVTACSDHLVRLFDSSGEQLAVLRGHEGDVRSAMFSPDGGRIVTSSWDHTARIWDLDGSERAVLRGHSDDVESAVFSPDGSRVLTASDDATARIRLVRFEDLFRLSDSRVTRELTREERETYRDILGQENEDVLDAWRAIDRIAKETVLVAELIVGVKTDPSLSDGVRAAALRLAASRTDAPRAIRDAVWMVVQHAGGSVETYRDALRRIEVAAALAPDDLLIASTRGVALHRTGDHVRAIEALTRCDAANVASGAGAQPEDVAFLAMSLHALGRADEAKATASRLRELVKDWRHRLSTASMRLFGEAFEAVRDAAAADDVAGYRAMDRLRRGTVLVSELIDAVDRDPDLAPAVRATAKRLAALEVDDPSVINDAVWSVVRAPGAQPDAYRLALRQITVAVRLAPSDLAVVNTLGVAQFRTGEFAAAVETLARTDRENSASADGAQPSDVAFLAMAFHALGRADDAKGELARLRELLKRRPHSNLEEARAFLAEAEASIGLPAAPPPK